MISKDKAATSDLLGFHGLPRVEHRIFHGPQLAGYVPATGNWTAMQEYFEKCGRDVVCKPNEGTGGHGVMRAQTPAELEFAVHRLFQSSRSICLSPFERIENEYRVAVMNGSVEFVYKKQRPAVVGDGKRTSSQLILDQLAKAKDAGPTLPTLAELAESKFDLRRVPRAGERVIFNWRHNLGQGAAPQLLNADDPATAQISALALRAVSVLGIALASVDIVDTDGGLKVLEINSGIMMEALVRALPGGRSMARTFYERIVCAALDLPPVAKTVK
jgi:glutathione synthase/RimK-type ligase-like ATP-grasp enzyme